jgi:NAD(P)-dependent dehydrogenase (short-subunit alcohol dehydrogenase family)
MNDGLGMKNVWDRLAATGIHVDVLVLNAAVTTIGPTEPLMDFLVQMNTAFEINVFGNARVAGYFLAQTPAMPERPKSLINISSFMAHSNPAPMQAAYASSKGAFAHIMQLLADEIGPERCTIVNVHPGAISTEAAKNLPQEMRDAVAWDERK